MPRQGSEIKEGILRYLEKKRSPVTFKELYTALRQFSEQGIRNRMYRMVENGIVEKIKEKTPRGRVSFKLKN